MNGLRAEPEKCGHGPLRCCSEDSQTPQKRGEAICATRKTRHRRLSLNSLAALIACYRAPYDVDARPEASASA